MRGHAAVCVVSVGRAFDVTAGHWRFSSGGPFGTADDFLDALRRPYILAGLGSRGRAQHPHLFRLHIRNANVYGPRRGMNSNQIF